MLLNARKNSFLFLFPKDFFDIQIQEKYKKNYLNSLLLPYDTVNDYMSSTIQSMRIPGWSMDTVTQIRHLGKEQEFKNSVPVEDLFERSFTIKFQLADGFLNYFLFLENAINYLNFKSSNLYFPIFRVGLINNDGYLLAHIDFHQVILKGMSEIDLSQSAVSQEFSSFDASFSFNDFRLHLDYGTTKLPNFAI